MQRCCSLGRGFLELTVNEMVRVSGKWGTDCIVVALASRLVPVSNIDGLIDNSEDFFSRSPLCSPKVTYDLSRLSFQPRVALDQRALTNRI
jgi:hypothetical protein